MCKESGVDCVRVCGVGVGGTPHIPPPLALPSPPPSHPSHLCLGGQHAAEIIPLSSCRLQGLAESLNA